MFEVKHQSINSPTRISYTATPRCRITMTTLDYGSIFSAGR